MFAAASLKNALEDAVAAFSEAGGAEVRLAFAGSSALARQIEHGAPADLFISANADWMDRLEEEGRIVAATRVDLLSNTLVLIGPAAGSDALPPPIDFIDAERAFERLDGGRVAIAFVDAVPAGIYAAHALRSLGLWDAARDSLIQVDNVRAALRLVTIGEAPFGVVYETDARAEPGVAVLATFPDDSHPPIVYPAAVIFGRPAAREAQAGSFLQYLSGDEAARIFEEHGFAVTASAP